MMHRSRPNNYSGGLEMTFNRKILFFIYFIFLSFQQSVAGSDVELSQAEIDSKLRNLAPLPKVHYYWPLHPRTEISNQTLYQLVRITHSLCLPCEWVKAPMVDRYVYTCARLNKTNPAIKASIGLVFVPWHQKFPKGLPPTNRGPDYYAELAHFEKRASLVKQWIAESNKKYQTDVNVTAVLFDSERFAVKHDDMEWNNGMREALDAIHTRAQSFFPDARMEWFERGAKSFGKGQTPYWTGDEIKASLSCSLYTLPDLELTRDTFRRTCKIAEEKGISDVTPWVALASGTRRGFRDVYFDHDWRYDLKYALQMGAELNIESYSKQPDVYAPYNYAKVIVFYPAPFDIKTPDWGRYFIAYVRGATGVHDVNDLKNGFVHLWEI